MKQHYHKVLLDLEHFNHWCDRANITVEFQFKVFPGCPAWGEGYSYKFWMGVCGPRS